VVLERNAEVGGKLAVLERDGFSFDIGPSLVTLPHLFDEVLRIGGSSLTDEVELVRLDPQFRYVWPDGSTLVVPDDPDATVAAFDAFAPGAGAAWRRFDAAGRRIWDVAERTFFAGPMSNPVDLAGRMRRPSDVTAIDPLRSLRRAASTMFDDPRLVQWAGRYATYSGSSPDRAPATLGCIPHVESRFGCWYPVGGLGRLRDALVRTAVATGVDVRTDTEVVRLVADSEAVHGVETAAGEHLTADVVVVNADAEHLYGDLLPDPRALRRVRRAERSTSGFVVCLGVAGATEGIAHHTVWFAPDPLAEFEGFRRGEVSSDPTIYACVSSVTDPSQAPAGDENWFLLVNTPSGVAIERDAHTALVLDRLAERGTDVRDRVRFVETLTPRDLELRYRAPGGAIYGTSSNGRRAAFVRPGNRGARRGLYLVGGSSHPGGGLPLVLMSARIVADLVASDHPHHPS
jgi:phytoene desaturase